MPAGLPHDFAEKARRIDKFYGSQDGVHTFDRHTRTLILEGTIPLWLAIGSVAGDAKCRKRCGKAIKELVKMREEYGSVVDKDWSKE